MGADTSCTGCKACGSNAYEFVLADYVLEDYQNWKIALPGLDKYDRFYRVVCDPMFTMDILEFCE